MAMTTVGLIRRTLALAVWALALHFVAGLAVPSETVRAATLDELISSQVETLSDARGTLDQLLDEQAQLVDLRNGLGTATGSLGEAARDASDLAALSRQLSGTVLAGLDDGEPVTDLMRRLLDRVLPLGERVMGGTSQFPTLDADAVIGRLAESDLASLARFDETLRLVGYNISRLTPQERADLAAIAGRLANAAEDLDVAFAELASSDDVAKLEALRAGEGQRLEEMRRLRRILDRAAQPGQGIVLPGLPLEPGGEGQPVITPGGDFAEGFDRDAQDRLDELNDALQGDDDLQARLEAERERLQAAIDAGNAAGFAEAERAVGDLQASIGFLRGTRDSIARAGETGEVDAGLVSNLEREAGLSGQGSGLSPSERAIRALGVIIPRLERDLEPARAERDRAARLLDAGQAAEDEIKEVEAKLEALRALRNEQAELERRRQANEGIAGQDQPLAGDAPTTILPPASNLSVTINRPGTGTGPTVVSLPPASDLSVTINKSVTTQSPSALTLPTMRDVTATVTRAGSGTIPSGFTLPTMKDVTATVTRRGGTETGSVTPLPGPTNVEIVVKRPATAVTPGVVTLPGPTNVEIVVRRPATTVTPEPPPTQDIEILLTELTRVVSRLSGGTNPFDVTDVETNIGGGTTTCSPDSAGNAGTPAVAINFDGTNCNVTSNTATSDILVSTFNATTVSLTTGGNCSGISPTTLGSGSRTFTVTCAGRTFTFTVTVSILAGGAGVAIKVDSIT